MAGYIGNIPVPQALRNYDVFTATSGQTVFNVKSYDPSFIDVYQNGVKLIDGDDYTATDGNTVVLASGATLNDIVEVISFTTFYPADVVSASAGGTFFGAVSFDGVTVTGDLTIADKIVHDGDTNTAIRFPAADTVTVDTAGSERVRVDSSGNVLCGSDGGGDIGSSTKRFKDLYLSGGVYVGGTGAANYLDDYEEGTFTPTATWISGGSTYAYYVKVGQLVHFNMFFNGVTVSSVAVTRIEGLPFLANAATSNFSLAVVGHGTAVPNCNSGYVAPNSTYIDLIENGTNSYAIESVGTQNMMITGTYYTA